MRYKRAKEFLGWRERGSKIKTSLRADSHFEIVLLGFTCHNYELFTLRLPAEFRLVQP